ncbi:MAG TPA: 2-oxo acid dehydrogenase subunit E2 [Puia sp.]|nr:2-oxo acid dehydrogenase subunit E2 [Puia sp.]
MALIEEIKVPLLAVNDTTLTVTELAFASGAEVKKGDVIMVFETSKTTYDVETPADGFIRYSCEPGRDYEVNEVVARIYSAAGEALVAPPTGHPSLDKGAPAPTGHPTPERNGTFPPVHNQRVVADWQGETIFSNEALRLLDTSGLDRSMFNGRDFVSAADVLEALGPAAAKPAGPASTGTNIRHAHPAGISRPATTPGPKPALPADPAKVVVQKLATAKKREIEYLADIQSTGLTSTIHTHIDTEGIFVHINRSLKYMRDSLLPVILYESSRLLTDYPQLNGYFTGDAIATYKEVNPGFAIDIDKGLKVLKVAGAGEKSLQDIESAIIRLSGDYLDDSIRLEDLTDITFTITDLSAEAVAFFKPLINKMNSAILGISAIDEKLQRCTLSLTFDHRVTEGKLAARFLADLKQRLESYRAEDSRTRQDIACFKCRKTLAEDLGDTGFVRCVTPAGKEGYICQSCIKGF